MPLDPREQKLCAAYASIDYRRIVLVDLPSLPPPSNIPPLSVLALVASRELQISERATLVQA
jgi:hypothetical protein